VTVVSGSATAQLASYWKGSGCSFPGGKEAGASSWPLTSSAEVKNAWSYTSTPQYVFMAWCLVKHRDFTFYILLNKHGRSVSPSWRWAPLGSCPDFGCSQDSCGFVYHGRFFLTKGWVCHVADRRTYMVCYQPPSRQDGRCLWYIFPFWHRRWTRKTIVNWKISYEGVTKSFRTIRLEREL
jgi:hypothetical protein